MFVKWLAFSTGHLAIVSKDLLKYKHWGGGGGGGWGKDGQKGAHLKFGHFTKTIPRAKGRGA